MRTSSSISGGARESRWRALRTAALLALCCAAAFVAPDALAAEAERVRGVVFLDRNGDGERTEGESGVPGVLVSNGRQVVATDEGGAYELTLEEGEVLFVVKPRDHVFPTSRDGLPRFFHVHRPSGTPASLRLRYPGVSPSGPLPASLDFPLAHRPEPDRFRAVVMSDPQPQTDEELSYVKARAIEPLFESGALFGLVLGDVLYDDLALFPRLVSLLGRLGFPWYMVPGNHDLNFRSPDDEHSLETFKGLFGPPYYAFDVGPATFVVLDTVYYEGANPDHPRDLGAYRGRLGERQLAWLESLLAQIPEERLLVVAMHIPLVSALAPEGTRTTVEDRRALLELLSGRPRLLALAGHLHVVEHHRLGEEEGFAGPGRLHLHTMAAASGSWWSGPIDHHGVPVSLQRDGAPAGYYLLEVDEERARARFVPHGEPPGPPLRIVYDRSFHGYGRNTQRDHRPGELLSGRIRASEVAATRVLVNLYEGGPSSAVWVRVGDRRAHQAERVIEQDPLVVEVFERAGDTLKGHVKPTASTHLFAAPLPEGLAPGVYRVEVRALDEYGQEHRALSILEVGSDASSGAR